MAVQWIAVLFITAAITAATPVNYPPSSAPTITRSANETMGPLRNRDIITCSVTGGKPLVSSVNFFCVDPDLPDQRDVINGENVTSYIIVDTSRATQKLMTCNCSATWEPEPGLYTQSASKQFPLQFAATVTNFTVDGSNGTTVSEGDNVHMQCSATGRPAASLAIDLRDSQVANSPAPPSNNSLEIVESQMGVDLNSLACNQTGTYTCLADNGVFGSLNQSSSSVFLNVTCGPRAADDTFKDGRIPQMNKTGLTFDLEANPPPDNFSYTFLGNTSNANGDSQFDSLFESECFSLQNTEYIVRCSVRPVKVPEEYQGIYNGTATNFQGSFNFNFEFTFVVQVPDGNSLSTGQIVTIALAVPGFIVNIITVIVFVYKLKRKIDEKEGKVAQIKFLKCHTTIMLTIILGCVPGIIALVVANVVVRIAKEDNAAKYRENQPPTSVERKSSGARTQNRVTQCH